MGRKRWLGLIAGLLLVAGTGCSRQDEQEAGGAEKQASGRRLQIAVIPKGTAQSFWQTVKAGAEQAGREENADITFIGPTEETATVEQKNIVDAQITRRVDAIVLAACDARALVPTVRKAQQAGIPVVTIDSGIDPDISYRFVATDNRKGGAAAAEALNKLLPDGGKVGLVPFVKGASSSDDREAGFKEALRQYPKLQLVSTLYSNSDVNKAQEVVNAMLAAHPDLAGIFAANQAGGVGAAQALKLKGLQGKVKLVAYDAGEEEIAALKAGIIQALIVQRPFEMGYQGVKSAIEAIRSGKVGSDTPVRVDTGVTTVTMENFNDPEIQKLLYPSGAPR
ncbi:MAG: ABC transporter substrate-binding protein [Chloroherpetonaceae bacterium]|nr:ABC transporter substrate-binding protein [Chthonomonadaceae bacterium]MDW8208269.1 ABC transporter substrate-binding protein [Chloroherpetonaceae bacterium]